VCGVTLRSNATSDELSSPVDVRAAFDAARHYRLKWFGHVERKSDDDWGKEVSPVNGRRLSWIMNR